jgi:hypothetical protein
MLCEGSDQEQKPITSIKDIDILNMLATQNGIISLEESIAIKISDFSIFKICCKSKCFISLECKDHSMINKNGECN